MDLNTLILTLEILSRGGPIILTKVSPAFAYENGVRTSKQIGLRLTVVFAGNNFQQQVVVVSSTVDTVSAALEKADANHPVHIAFDGFQARIYNRPDGKGAAISAKATAVRVVQPPETGDELDFD